jgi:hypothetical protein
VHLCTPAQKPQGSQSRLRRSGQTSRYGAAVDWVLALVGPAVGLLIAAGGWMFAQRSGKRKAAIDEFHWIIERIESPRPSTQRAGIAMLRDFIASSELRDEALRRRAMAAWVELHKDDAAEADGASEIEIVPDAPPVESPNTDEEE